MSPSSIGSTTRSSSTDWSPRTPVTDSAGSYDQVAAAVSSSTTIPSAYDKSWMTKNLSTQDKATITATTGVTFGADGSILVPMSASPNDSDALQRTIHLLNSQRGGFGKDLTPEELLRLIKQNAQGANLELLQDFLKPAYSDGKAYA